MCKALLLISVFFSVFQLSFSQKKIVVQQIKVLGNSTTKNYIIHKELSFKVGDTVLVNELLEKLEQSKKNLLNTSLFHVVNLRLIGDSILSTVEITVKERWYTWPQLLVKFEDRNFFDWWQYRTFDRMSYGFYLTRYNFRGRQETIQLKVKFGYSKEIGFIYKIPYLIRQKNHGLNLSVLAVKRHEIYYKSIDDRIVYLKNPEKTMRSEFNAFTEYIYRYKLYQKHAAKLHYDIIEVNDTIVSVSENPHYLLNNANSAKFFSLSYTYRNDRRDSKNYPLLGYDLEIELKKYGLSAKPNEVNTASLSASMKRFWKINQRWSYSAGLKSKVFLTQKTPFYIARGLGFYNDYVRGYEPYFISGNNFAVFKTNFKYRLVKPALIHLPYLKNEKLNTLQYALYFNLLFDAGYISDSVYTANNYLANTLLLGYGVGLDFVSSYDKVLRIELSQNKRGQSGIYLSFIAPI